MKWVLFITEPSHQGMLGSVPANTTIREIGCSPEMLDNAVDRLLSHTVPGITQRRAYMIGTTVRAVPEGDIITLEKRAGAVRT